MEKIIEIKEIAEKYKNSEYEGYAITTDKQIIKMFIQSEQNCCERWGYFMSEDDFSEFIGSELINIELTDKLLNKVDLAEYDITEPWEGDIMFVNLNTTNGALQFVAYNKHNGYYGHTAIIMSQQLNYSIKL